MIYCAVSIYIFNVMTTEKVKVMPESDIKPRIQSESNTRKTPEYPNNLMTSAVVTQKAKPMAGADFFTEWTYRK